MTWHNPTTYAEMSDSIGKVFNFHSTLHDIEGEAIHVLSGSPFNAERRATHGLTERVARSADETRERYMTRGAYEGRSYPPDAIVYYVWDRRSWRVMAAVTQGGEVLDDIENVRPDLVPNSVAKIREGLAGLASVAALLSH